MAMADPLRFVGCIGQRINCTSPVSHVIVDSYDSETGEYLVKILGKSDECIYRLQPSDVAFQTTEFLDVFSNPLRFIIQDKLDMANIPSGSIVDFSECSSAPVIDGGKLFVRGSYRFVGRRSKLNNNMGCLTRLSFCVYIGAQNDSDVIEFENIVFDGYLSNHNVFCLRGNIRFRNCCFMGDTNGLKVGSGNVPVIVSLETCNITNGRCGVVVEQHGDLNCINTRISSRDIGVSIKEGGVCKAQYSVFFDSIYGVILSGTRETSQLSLVGCNLKRHKRCSVLALDGTFCMERSNVANCPGVGIWLSCNILSDLNAQIGNCRVYDCGCGMKIADLTTLHLNNCTITGCDVGLHSTSDCSGDLTCDKMMMERNVINVADFRDSESTLYVDGVRRPYRQRKNVQAINDAMHQLSTTEYNILGKLLVSEFTLKTKHFIVKSAIDAADCYKPQCENCNMRGPFYNSFKKCGRCKQVVIVRKHVSKRTGRSFTKVGAVLSKIDGKGKCGG